MALSGRSAAISFKLRGGHGGAFFLLIFDECWSDEPVGFDQIEMMLKDGEIGG